MSDVGPTLYKCHTNALCSLVEEGVIRTTLGTGQNREQELLYLFKVFDLNYNNRVTY